MLSVEGYRKDAEKLFAEVEREYVDLFAGYKDAIDLKTINAKYTHLLDPELIPAYKLQMEAMEEGVEKRGLRILLYDLVEKVNIHRNQELQQEAMRFVQKAQVTLPDGEKMAYNTARVKLGSEKDRSRRQAMARVIREVQKGQAEHMAPIFDSEYRLIEEYGFEGYVPMYLELKEIDYHGLDLMLMKFLDDTDAMYEKWLATYAKEILGLDVKELEQHDIPVLLKGVDFDELFPGDKVIDVIKAWSADLGIDYHVKGRVQYDLEYRPNKSPRAWTMPVWAGKEVYVVCTRFGGFTDYESIIHEYGHAQHRGMTDETLPYEYKQLGDKTVSEHYAYIFQTLVEEPKWLNRYLGLDCPEEMLRFLDFKRLFALRRGAAKIHYELQLHDGTGTKGKDKAFADAFTRATMIPMGPEGYLSFVDPGFYSACYARAELLEEQADHYLKDRFGKEWFADKEAGAFLTELWIRGMQDYGQDLARQYGFEDVDTGPALEAFKKRFDQA
ncbi:MAG: gluzincin family metallopeptidase [Planctomycetota bacterium]|jgi:hypothetical protein